MRGLAFTLAMMLGGVASAQTPVASPPLVVTEVPAAPTCENCVGSLLAEADGSRNFLQSDHEFPDFIGPITSPILSKDPRSLTEVRPLFINNWIPRGNAVLQGGDFQVYAMQARIALTERLTLIADKDGIATLSPRTLPSRSGWLDLAAGLKYTLYRDVENQALGAVGFLYEAPSGEAQVFQNHGSGLLTVFGVWGQQFGDNWHILINQAFSFGLDSKQNSNFFFTQVHLDKQCFGWLYPLAELNWY